ncbi:hypothetical protein [Pedobacter psychroterrae]|uniref:Glycosyl transferase family 2 n=1 Tax=Pedobacter psychroterrae TaxID=2530453 RepID=A0A4R0NT31_9SPHI|nr:hypothetical protein [Pedobacter psychroterrae]TCD03309.1 hypothetical protein EZ437_04875 [Pedobacter psychroterrae]
MNSEDGLGIIRKPVILLTGCINPKGMTFTALQNPDFRRAQYIDAINFYLKVTDNVIIFVENSGVDISAEFEGHKDRLEVLTFLGNDYPKELGKGYGEMLIIEYAFEHSSLVNLSSSVCKITGRYKILNINSILRSYSGHRCDVMVDLTHKMTYADSRIFLAEKSFFNDYLFKRAGLINDTSGVHFEHILNRSVFQAIVDNYAYLPLKYRPRIMGQSGTDKVIYDHSFFPWFRKNLRKMIRFKLFLKE